MDAMNDLIEEILAEMPDPNQEGQQFIDLDKSLTRQKKICSRKPGKVCGTSLGFQLCLHECHI